ncbi:alpha/beta hydrolase [Naasia sp. SYSU D00948]|uniref:alpha/beta hydrolase n=1 Tax=Naasia sp. SYSU D00948 TaxID=2817379 RepID=UPI001B30208C|nr:alpha/beta fold hydrolase [Naasia sp. SYSU D00948]
MEELPDPRLDPAAVLWSSRIEELAERPLLVLLHGIGADEGDLFSMSPQLPLHPVIASLRAPTRHGPGWSWYDLGTPGDPNSEGVDAAARAVLAWLDELPVQPPSVGVLGFSQGAAVAAQALRHDPSRFSYAVLLSGYVTSGTVEGDEELARLAPPVFWGRGTEDYVIPPIAIAYTAEWLPRHTTLDARIYEGVGHSVSQQELADIVGFLRDRQR